MQRDEYLAVIRRDGEALLAAAQQVPGARVRGCPEWDTGDLVWHIGAVHNFWGTVVDRRLTDPSGYEPPTRPEPAALVAFAREQLEFVSHVLEATDPATEVFTWTPDHTAGWVTRRMAHETIMHRWDAEDAAGIDATIDAALASDGVDEFLSYFLRDDAGDTSAGAASVHLHATDTPGEWVVRFGDGVPVVTREHAKGDAAVRGPAADLLLALWHRVPLDRLEVIGDEPAAARFFARSSRE
jgi:uncharacterized protein (TIGR03083 family)